MSQHSNDHLPGWSWDPIDNVTASSDMAYHVPPYDGSNSGSPSIADTPTSRVRRSRARASTADADTHTHTPDVTGRPSLFSDAPPPVTNMASSSSAPTGRHGSLPELVVPPLSTLAGRPSPSAASQGIPSPPRSISHHRPRRARVAKDHDDPDSPDQARYSINRDETSTPTTLSRLMAGQSRSTSFNTEADHRSRTLLSESATLSGHLYTQGLLSGRHSDITVAAFGSRYRLHRLMLARSPFFSTALSGDWLESTAKEISVHPEDVDPNITRTCFELALKRLYGAQDEEEETEQATGLFATACWLEMPDLLDSSTENMLRLMKQSTLGTLIKLVTGNYYGRAGDKLLASAKAMLCRDGWKMPLHHWDSIPADIVREIVGGDGFYVEGEWARWVLARRIFNRRLRIVAMECGVLNPGESPASKIVPDTVKMMAIRFDNVYRRNAIRTNPITADSGQWVALYTHPEVEPLLVLLDEGIHYIHLNYEQLQFIKKSKDSFGLPIMPEKVLSDALWMQLDLRQRIVNAAEGAMELGLSQPAEESGDSGTLAHDLTRATAQSSGKGKQPAMEAEEASSDSSDVSYSESWDGTGQPRKFWIPSADCNIVMGGATEPIVATSAVPGAQRPAARLSVTLSPEDVQWAADFGAAANDSRPGAESMLVQGAEIKPVSYTLFPPFRFAAEFPNPRLLKEKKRVYSRTIFYAGSLWNIYIQKVKSSKNPQLGVYLHRAKERETEDVLINSGGMAAESVDERIGRIEREMRLRFDRERQLRRQAALALERDNADEADSSGSASIDPRPSMSEIVQPLRKEIEELYRAQLPGAAREAKHKTAGAVHDADAGHGLDSDDDDDECAAAAAQAPTLPPYVDARPTIKTYFKIYSPSKGGRMLSVYESAPDRFNFSQSWGWKSSTLMLDEGFAGDAYLGSLPAGAVAGGGTDELGVGGARRNEARLRFMVVIGNI